MIKNDLREQGFSIMEKYQKQSKITVIWVSLTLLLIAATFVSSVFIIGIVPDFDDTTLIVTLIDSVDESISAFAPMPVPYVGYMLFLLVLVLLYFALKLIMTILFCRDKNNSIKLKLLSDKMMPVCYCREALRVWQIVLIYITPIALIYSFIFRECLLNASHPGLMIILFYMSFFLAYDLTLVMYVLFIKIRYRVDYIAIDHHIYDVTLYKKTYIRFRKNAKNAKFLTASKYLENGKFNWSAKV